MGTDGALTAGQALFRSSGMVGQVLDLVGPALDPMGVRLQGTSRWYEVTNIP